MAADFEVHIWDGADLNGDTIAEWSSDDTFIRGLSFRPALTELGGGSLVMARKTGMALFGTGILSQEHFARILVPRAHATRYQWSFFFGDILQALIRAEEAGAEYFEVSGPGPKWYLSRAILWDERFGGTGFVIDRQAGVFRFPGNASDVVNAGFVLNRLITEDQHNSLASFLPDLTKSFSGTTDSAGVAWANVVGTSEDPFEVQIGADYLTDLWDLEDNGDLETTMYLGEVGAPLLRLDAWQTYGRDLTAADVDDFGSSVTHLKEGVNITSDLDAERDFRRKASHVLVRGGDGRFGRGVRPTWDPGEYARATSIEYGNITNIPTLERRASRFIRHQDYGSDEAVVELVPGDDPDDGGYFPAEYVPAGTAEDGGGTPGPSFWIGDTLSLTTGATGGGFTFTPLDYRNEPERVLAIDYEYGPGGAAAGDGGSDLELARSWRIIPVFNVDRGSASTPAGPSGGAGGGTPCNCIRLCHAAIAADPDTLDHFFDANDPGDDGLQWTGLLSNQGGSPGQGAEGSSYYSFKSSSPTEWSNPFRATVPGETRRFTGYVSLADGTRKLKVGFFTSTQSAASPGNSANLIGTATILATGPAGGWTFFDSGDVVAPAGAAWMCYGKDGSSITFDRLRSYIVGENQDPSNVLDGTRGRASRCDHQHHWLSVDPPDVTDDVTKGFAVGTVWLQVDDVDAPTSLTASWVLLDSTGGAAVWESSGGGSSYTDEQAQDAVGTILTDSASVDLAYNDATPSISALVIPSGIKLDDLGTPDDNTDLDATASEHGLLPKLPGDPTKYLDGDGNYTDPGLAGGATGNVIATPSGSAIYVPGLALGDRKPASPGTYDQEFDGTADTLPTDYSWDSTPADWHLNSRWPSLLTVEGTANVIRTLTRANFAPGAGVAFGIWCKAYIGLLSSADNNALRFYVSNAGGTERRGVNFRATGSHGNGIRGLKIVSNVETVWWSEIGPGRVSEYYFGITRDASDNWSAWISSNGIGWDRMDNAAQLHAFTVDRLTITLGVAAVPSLVGMDWIRYRTDNAFPRP